MPIFEYACQNCGKEFETIVHSGQKPQCPKCESTKLRQKLSVFAVASSGKTSETSFPASDSACGTCGDPRGPGACSLDDD